MNEANPIFDSKTRLAGSALACRRGGRCVFEGLNFEVQAGDFLSLTGKNGSGKSTFLRLIAGLIPESDGAVSYSRGDETLNFLNNDDFTLVGHQNGLKPSMTLRENAQFYYKLMTGKRPAADRMQMAADIFALGSLLDEPAQYFSSGQRHRSALMRFPLVARQIWLMDEPTVGLDADNRAALSALIQHHVACGGIVIAASHDPMGVEGLVMDMDQFQPSAAARNTIDEDWL